MKRNVLWIYSLAPKRCSILSICLLILMSQTTNPAIVPPPWSDPKHNPCASMPGGWQLLYWPPLKKCFKIFTIGYPCPETMELSPTNTSGRRKSDINKPAAECRCPPNTALDPETNKCYKLFERGPCDEGQYFEPNPEPVNDKERRVGSCKSPPRCPSVMTFWPKDNKCYKTYTKGPCQKGKLFVRNEEGLGECLCTSDGELGAYFYETEQTCHEHYTKGPCSTPGHLFLPDGLCNCQQNLPHYHEEQKMCFEMDTPGPCKPGHVFRLPQTDNAKRAVCQCKDGYIPWSDGNCYRLYTRGPCKQNEFLVNATSCIQNLCGKGRLYFPDQATCYRIGSQGPCSLHQVVVFDYTARPSLEGISYKGICGCSGVIKNLNQQCSLSEQPLPESTAIITHITHKGCEATQGLVSFYGNCFKLYTRGPCGPGQWLTPLKAQVIKPWRQYNNNAKCVCRPGYILEEKIAKQASGDEDFITPYNRESLQKCNAPNFGLARWFLEIFG